ncbi:hypothetical protein DID88_008313 [Monilinia fructigena]|uniref:Rit1 N-terminal domain-containing protein n=1 Tax=Monilinia fructigena TaxID=38457 RepID=A0A395J600_9HELO|nr:hypothetical protein DID88_008313 [Monilinia fructigena]
MPLTIADILFNEQANHNFSKTLGEIKRTTLSIHNRLRSILEDAEFAKSVANAYNRPLIANERCGSWYIDPNKKGGSAYFKSTDGHTGVWKFSSRRLNLHLLEIIGNHDGCIIVDSTRRGKRMPDALSKTIPIWCCVLNRVFFPNDPVSHQLYAPPQVVSDSEQAQMSNLIPQFVRAFQTLNLPLETFRERIQKPIRPIWVTPESHVSETNNVFEDFHPIICCTVSRRVSGEKLVKGVIYKEQEMIQKIGLTGLLQIFSGRISKRYWKHLKKIYPSSIKALIGQQGSSLGSKDKSRLVKPTSCLSISTIDAVPPIDSSVGICTILLLPKVTPKDTWQTSPSRIDVGLGPKKSVARISAQPLGISPNSLPGT